MRASINKKHELIITVDPNMPDFSKSPFALKKAEKARAFIAKHGLPGNNKSKKK